MLMPPRCRKKELVSKLRERGNRVPTIMIMATAAPKIERRAAELGIRQVLKKPLSNQLLLGAIRAELAAQLISELYY